MERGSNVSPVGDISLGCWFPPRNCTAAVSRRVSSPSPSETLGSDLSIPPAAVRASYASRIKEMATTISSHHPKLSLRLHGNLWRARANKFSSLGYSTLLNSSGGAILNEGQYVFNFPGKSYKSRISISKAMSSDTQPGDTEDANQDKEFQPSGSNEAYSRISRDDLERLVGKDDSSFSGFDLATLIRKKYGRSYDVQLIKKEFMGRRLLAMNVMWKYREQRSFPLTEEEYILRLDDVANTLKCWGAVSHIRNSLERLKERPRIGKAVSIFIDMDETGGRSREWIYK